MKISGKLQKRRYIYLLLQRQGICKRSTHCATRLIRTNINANDIHRRVTPKEKDKQL